MRQIHNTGLDEAAVLAQAPEQTGSCYGWCCKPQSSDTSNMKLSIRRQEDGTVLAHCFHCGNSGVWLPDQRVYTADEMRERLERLGRHSAAEPKPHDMGNVADDTAGTGESEGESSHDSDGRRPPMNWLGYYKMPIDTAWSDERVPDSVYHMVYGRWRLPPDVVRHRQMHALVRSKNREEMIPERDGDAWVSVGSYGNPIQYRRVGLNEQGHSKWYTIGGKPTKYYLFGSNLTKADPLIVVEDIPSAMYLRSLCSDAGLPDVATLALMGTSVDRSKLPNLATSLYTVSRVFVWLDNDSVSVTQKSIANAVEIGNLYNCPAKTIREGDPKDFNPYRNNIIKLLT